MAAGGGETLHSIDSPSRCPPLQQLFQQPEYNRELAVSHSDLSGENDSLAWTFQKHTITSNNAQYLKVNVWQDASKQDSSVSISGATEALFENLSEVHGSPFRYAVLLNYLLYEKLDAGPLVCVRKINFGNLYYTVVCKDRMIPVYCSISSLSIFQ